MLIVYCSPNNISLLWDNFSNDLIEAIKYKFDLKTDDKKLLE